MNGVPIGVNTDSEHESSSANAGSAQTGQRTMQVGFNHVRTPSSPCEMSISTFAIDFTVLLSPLPADRGDYRSVERMVPPRRQSKQREGRGVS